MSPTRLALLESLFDAALGLPETVRESFIDESTSHDPGLAAELRALLSAHALSDSVFVSPVHLDRDQLSHRWIGARLGAYEIGAQIGSGGMGTVHEAVRADDQYRQRVAVKFLNRSAEGGVAVRRFRAERQMLASLQHPNIASLVDGGVTPDGLPYFVMEYIDGEPITRWCDSRNLGIAARLNLFGQVCAAVRAAHQKLIVHRDLKPGNILVTTDGAVKLLDFGIAKLMRDERTLELPTATQVGHRAFTPEYAAPEQLRGTAVDTTADVYALGVVLYELLAGQRPFDLHGKSLAEMERIVCDQPAQRPSSVLGAERWRALSERSPARARRAIEGDLDAVVMMALRKEPERRYPSVDALARDVTQHLEQQPVQARPDSLGYRVRKFVRRRQLETIAGIVAVVSLVGGTAAAVRQARLAEIQRLVATAESARATEQSARAAEVTKFLTTMLNSSNPEAFGKDVTMRTVLDSAVMRADSAKLSPELETEVRGIMGGAYLALGELDIAERQFGLVMAARRRTAPDGDYGTAVTYSQLSLVEETRSNLVAADSLLHRAELLFERFPHADRREESTALENRARVLYQLGKVPDAIALMRKSLALGAQYFAADDSARAPSFANAAVIFSEAGELPAADSFSLRGIESAKRAHGMNHPMVANAYSIRAGILEMQNRMDESTAAYLETLAIKRRLLGPQHISYATTAVNYTDHLMRSEKWREAANMAREILALRGKSLDESSYPVQGCLMHLGRALAHLDSAKAGERLVREVRALREKSLPAGHWLLASADGALGEVIALDGRYAEAERLLLSAESRVREARGVESGPVADQRKRLVALYKRWGRAAEAAAWQARLDKKSA
ncbi:MAG: serine/threonine protein kinase [Gemmatimonadaceae bacterium]|nr:serine/threonine protein kinase [Gemmatimonadaceae bacterium]